MKHPPFNTGADAVTGRNVCSEAGAKMLAVRIAEAWRKVGVTVRPELVQVLKGGQSREPLWAVHLPGFVNGMPPRE